MVLRYIGTSEAARRLGVSSATVRNWIRDGRLQGTRGTQPSRPRCFVLVDAAGRPLGAGGTPLQPYRGAAPEGERPPSERQRDAALQLSAVLETHRKAFGLALEALKFMDQALAEQGNIIAGLLIGDPAEIGDRV